MIILASASPRRQQLLHQIGVPHEVLPANVDETPLCGELPCDYVQRVANSKALAVFTQCSAATVLAADTTVVVDGQILGKPEDADHARRMLAQLSGRCHQVMTALSLVRGGHSQPEYQQVRVTTDVTFAVLSATTIDRYMLTSEPFGKAGGYAIQGFAAAFVQAVHGSYSNVVGLPLAETADCLQRWQIPIWQEILC
ncbi:MAG: septum formation inhibitor Maf [Bacterioplanes sp.]|nr:septum formation inhibitor Maf [Bacterioplanes sp.]